MSEYSVYESVWVDSMCDLLAVFLFRIIPPAFISLC